jgi:hypothetical protein
LTAALAFIVGAGSATAAACPVPTDSAASSGGIGVHLLDAPTDRADDPRAREYIVDHLAPGAVIRRRIQVSSTARIPLHVELYAAAASIDGGSFTFASDRSPDELSSWVSIGAPSLELRAHGTAAVEATISVPKEASPGERYAVIWAQVASALDPASGLRAVNRVGIRVYLDVGPGGEPPSDFRITSLTPARTPDGRPEVLAELHNTGGRALDMTGNLTLSDGPGSLSAGPFPAKLGTTLGIGDSEPVAVPLDRQLPDGPWTAHLTMASGIVEHAVSATLTFPDAGVGAKVAMAGGLVGGSLIVSTALIATAVGCVLAMAFWWVMRRRRLR